ncbi:MAG TPA: hypothetical protein VNS88_14925, partial [Nitrospiraceae bacterium]|nr:hypothetical protein [Nitrospiraceae bacterium]
MVAPLTGALQATARHMPPVPELPRLVKGLRDSVSAAQVHSPGDSIDDGRGHKYPRNSDSSVGADGVCRGN